MSYCHGDYYAVRTEIVGALLAAPLSGRASPAPTDEWQKLFFKNYDTASFKRGELKKNRSSCSQKNRRISSNHSQMVFSSLDGVEVKLLCAVVTFSRSIIEAPKKAQYLLAL